MLLTDTHSHLYSTEFQSDIENVVKNGLQNGVNRVFLPNIDHESIGPMFDLADRWPDVFFPMMGLHPCSVGKDFESVLADMKAWFGKRKCYGVGETGIDLYWDKTFIEEQKQAFRIQIDWAKELQLPLIIHVRESFTEVLEIIDQMNDERLTGIFHCFTGTTEQAQHIIGYKGFKLGIGGVVTYKTSTLPEVLKSVDPKHLVLETDSPYLPPVPFRGKRNESGYVLYVAKKLAEVYETNIEEIARITNENASLVFKV